MNNNNPPDISGDWYYFSKILRQNTLGSKPSFNEYNYSQYETNIIQDGHFIIQSTEPDPPLRPSAGYKVGYWNKVYTNNNNFFWQLVQPDYDDNGIYLINISEKNNNGIVTKLTGVYYEGGFNTTNPSQLPSVGGISFTRLSYK
jgi:hypothetical protein